LQQAAVDVSIATAKNFASIRRRRVGRLLRRCSLKPRNRIVVGRNSAFSRRDWFFTRRANDESAGNRDASNVETDHVVAGGGDPWGEHSDNAADETRVPFVFFPFRYAGEGFSCGEIPGVGRTTPFDGTGVGFSFSGSTFGERRSSSGCPAISNLTSTASRDSRSSSASAIRISASRFSTRIFLARS